MSILLHIAERVLNTPLLVHPDKLPLVLAVLEGRLPIAAASEEFSAEAERRIALLPADAQAIMRGPVDASRFAGSPVGAGGQYLDYAVTADGVALIPVIGSLVNRGAWLGVNSGKTSYEGLQHQVRQAAADPNVKAILLDIASGGGEATGAFETASIVREAAAQKPVTALVNGMAASAAYAIAAGASTIVTTETGVVGSIGVVMMHADYSRKLEKDGVTPTLIFAGAHKVDGHPFAPLADDVRTDLQKEVDQFYSLFVQSVAAGRKQLSPAAIRATEARTFIGADAVAAGLADSVGTFDQVLADLSRGLSGRSNVLKGPTMNDKTGAAAASPTANVAPTSVAELQAAFPALCSSIAIDAATGERNRILGIQGLDAAGHGTLIADMVADGKTTPAEAALRVNQAQKAARGQHATSDRRRRKDDRRRRRSADRGRRADRTTRGDRRLDAGRLVGRIQGQRRSATRVSDRSRLCRVQKGRGRRQVQDPHQVKRARSIDRDADPRRKLHP
jgi:signal peptide peptidase SppA